MNTTAINTELKISYIKLAIATEEATQSVKEFSEEFNSIRSRYTDFGWFLYRLGVL